MQMLINKFIEYDLFESVEILIPELKRDSPSIYWSTALTQRFLLRASVYEIPWLPYDGHRTTRQSVEIDQMLIYEMTINEFDK